MIVIEGRKYLTWEDTFQRRREVRVDVYLGAELMAEVKRRSEAVDVTISPFIRDIVREWVNTHPLEDAPYHPQED
jgi:hypothetical protein